jgi:plasmid stabilization system protein ParE
VKLRYTQRAIVELDEILTHIAERSPGGARRVQARIHAIIESTVKNSDKP